MKHLAAVVFWIKIILGLIAFLGYVYCVFDFLFGSVVPQKILTWLHIDISPSVMIWITILSSLLVLLLEWGLPYLRKRLK